MLGRRPGREDAKKGAAAKKRKWQESDDDESAEEKITDEDMDRWRETMREEERQDLIRRERERKEQELERERRAVEEEEERKRKLEEERAKAQRAEEALRKAAFEAALAESRRLKEVAALARPPAAEQLSLGAPGSGENLFTAACERLQAVAAAAAAVPGVNARCAEALAQTSSAQGWQAAPAWDAEGWRRRLPAAEDVSTINFAIPTSKVCDVLGVRGKNVQQVKQRSGIQKITILDSAEPATVSVTGTPAQVERARSLVLALAGGDQTCVGNTTDAIAIEAHLVPRIIGPKGQTMTQMKEQSGAYIAVRRSPEGAQQQVEMTGRPEAVAVARRLVEAFLAEVDSSKHNAAEQQDMLRHIREDPPWSHMGSEQHQDGGAREVDAPPPRQQSSADHQAPTTPRPRAWGWQAPGADMQAQVQAQVQARQLLAARLLAAQGEGAGEGCGGAPL